MAMQIPQIPLTSSYEEPAARATTTPKDPVLQQIEMVKDVLNIQKTRFELDEFGLKSSALKRRKAAIDSGATAVKFQTYTAATMTLDLDTDSFKISAEHPLWGGRKLYELYDEAHTPWAWHSELFEICRRANVIPFSSPFDTTAVDFLETLNVEMYKIASMETGDLPLIRRVAETGKPLIVSTGATEWQEIEDLVRVVE